MYRLGNKDENGLRTIIGAMHREALHRKKYGCAGLWRVCWGHTASHWSGVWGSTSWLRLSDAAAELVAKMQTNEAEVRRDNAQASQSASVSVSVWITPPRMCVPQLVKTIDVLGKEVAIARKNIKFLTKDSATLRAQLQQFVLAWLHVVCVWVLYVSVCLTECLCVFFCLPAACNFTVAHLSACLLQSHSRWLLPMTPCASRCSTILRGRVSWHPCCSIPVTRV